jgi:GNAT superfamily N-acetyltransferase
MTPTTSPYSSDDIVIRPISPARWDDLVELFGTRGDPSWCWCQYFLTTGRSYEESAERNKADLRAQIESAAVPQGLIAYAASLASDAGTASEWAEEGLAERVEEGIPVGWVQVGPRTGFPRITQGRDMSKVVDDLDDESVWAVTCFVVRVGWRRKGIGGALLEAAVELARASDATALVGHPVDVAARTTRVGGSELYHGAASTFARAGFREVGRTGATRPVVRLSL